MFGATKTNDLSPREVKAALDAHEILLIDVREPAEFAAERIHGAVNFPLSTFDPRALPKADDKRIVFQCGVRQTLGHGRRPMPQGGSQDRRPSGRRDHGLEGRRAADRVD